MISRRILRSLSARRARNLLRYWMRSEGLNAASESRLLEIDAQLRETGSGSPRIHADSARARAEIRHAGSILVGYRDLAYWIDEAQGLQRPSTALPTSSRLHGDARTTLPDAALPEALRADMPAAALHVVFEGAREGGSRPLWHLPQWQGVLHLVDADLPATRLRVHVDRDALIAGRLRVAPRQGGERLRLGVGRPSRSLKHHFQEAGVPPRQRAQPLFYLDDQLFFVPYVGGCGLREGSGAASVAAVLPASRTICLEWVADAEGAADPMVAASSDAGVATASVRATP